MTAIQVFEKERETKIQLQGNNDQLKNAAAVFLQESINSEYSYNFSWMGRPIIQYPQDMIAMQELIWKLQPDLIIETGIAHGGSILFYASILELIGKGEVLGIDIDIRQHNKDAILNHPMSKRVKMIEGSSTGNEVLEKVKTAAEGKQVIMVCLDSNHTHQHVLEELRLYSPFVTSKSYLVVFDTIVEDLPAGTVQKRPWDIGDNPKTAVFEFLKENTAFEIDVSIDNKLLISVAPSGYLRKI
jgi:cephalosporin hydroxylase